MNRVCEKRKQAAGMQGLPDLIIKQPLPYFLHRHKHDLDLFMMIQLLG